MAETTRARAGTLVVVAALVPIIVGGVQGEAKKPEAPKADEGKLTVHLGADAHFGDGGSAPIRHLLLTAAGTPPGSKVELVDGHGRNRTVVNPVDESKCRRDDVIRRSTGLTEAGIATRWCLEITGLRAGSEVTGILKGEKSNVALTLGLRHRRLFGPLFAAVVGFFAGLGAVFALPFVVGVSRKSALDGLVEDNDAQTEAERISGLREWVKQQREGKAQSDTTLLPLVERIIRHGPDSARTARGELRLALSLSPVPADQPVRKEGTSEAKRTDHKSTDFIDDERKDKEHPAVTLKGVLGKIEGIKKALDDAVDRIGRIKVPSSKLINNLASAQQFFARAKRDETAALEEEVAKLHRAIDFVAPPRTTAAAATAAADEAAAWSLPSVPRDVATVLRWAVIVIAGLLAFVALNFSIYDPATTFGTVGDYYKLMAAAAGSAAVASIGSVLAWRSPPSGSK